MRRCNVDAKTRRRLARERGGDITREEVSKMQKKLDDGWPESGEMIFKDIKF